MNNFLRKKKEKENVEVLRYDINEKYFFNITSSMLTCQLNLDNATNCLRSKRYSFSHNSELFSYE